MYRNNPINYDYEIVETQSLFSFSYKEHQNDKDVLVYRLSTEAKSTAQLQTKAVSNSFRV